MNARIGFALAALAVFLNGCASPPQQSVFLSQNALGSQAGRVGVAMTALPKVDTHLRGAGCLLCMAAAAVANSSLTSHAQTLPHEDLSKLKNDVAELLRKKGTAVTVVDEHIDLDQLADYAIKGPNVANKDFTLLRQKYNVDKLLVIDITALGFVRPYSAYIPTGDPKGMLEGKGYIVNLKSNAYEWYVPVSIVRSADGKWDEPPKFPGLTNAYFQTLELGKDVLLKPFRN